MRAIYAENLKQLVDEEWFDCQEKSSFFDEIDRTPTIDVMPVRCKDCKHRPTMPEDAHYRECFELEFPDDICPLQCGDSYYNREPDDDWFCANGERDNNKQISV